MTATAAGENACLSVRMKVVVDAMEEVGSGNPLVSTRSVA
jgi:hypothetical protein